MKKRILAVGNIYNCLYASISSLPLLNSDAYGDDFRYFPGGGILTSSVAMARFGSDVSLCAKVGDDRKAKTLLSYLQNNNIETRYIKGNRNGKTGMMIYLCEEKGGKRRIVFPMSNTSMQEDDIENAFTSYPDALYIQGDLADDITLTAFRYAKKNGCGIFYQPCKSKNKLDPKRIPPLEALILDGSEVYSLCGIDVKQYEKCLPACMALSALYDVKYTVIRMPERGTFIYDGKYHEIIRTFHTSEQDKDGCAQIFGGVMCSHYLETQNIRQAVCMGNIAYAMFADSPGDIPSAPTFEDIRRYITKNEINFE